MPVVIKRVVGYPFRIGGVQHSGWLPPGAAMPEPTPVHETLLDLSIESDGGSGYLLIYQATDGNISGDDWHETISDAIDDAKERFGIEAAEWEDV